MHDNAAPYLSGAVDVDVIVIAGCRKRDGPGSLGDRILRHRWSALRKTQAAWGGSDLMPGLRGLKTKIDLGPRVDRAVEGYDLLYQILLELDELLLWTGWPLLGTLHDPTAALKE